MYEVDRVASNTSLKYCISNSNTWRKKIYCNIDCNTIFEVSIAILFAILWYTLTHRLGVCPSVCLSHSWAVSKRCKLGSRNLYFGLPQGL